MAPKSLYFLIISALFLDSPLFRVSSAFSSRKALAAAPAPGDDEGVVLAPGFDRGSTFPPGLGFVPLNPKDLKVIELAKFAIDEYNKANDPKLAFVSVLEALSTDAGAQGTNYQLVVLATTVKNELNVYSANVLADNDAKKLVSFKQDQ